MNIAGLLLAAGSGRRFGGDKRRALLPNGRGLLEQSLSTLYPNVDRVVIVVKTEEAWLRSLLARFANTQVLCVPDTGGVGDSLAAAIQFVAADPTVDGVLVALADMPWLNPDTLQKLVAALAQYPLVAPCYQGRRGHPVGFARRYFPPLAQCRGDRGAQSLLATEVVHLCPVKDGGVLGDVDRREHLLRASPVQFWGIRL